MTTAIVFFIAAIAGALIFWFCKRSKRKAERPEVTTKAGPGNTGPGTGTPR
jgi:hypothetical protein